jgi:hypothetical protein
MKIPHGATAPWGIFISPVKTNKNQSLPRFFATPSVYQSGSKKAPAPQSLEKTASS